MSKKEDKVFIQIDNERIELKGVDLEAFEAERAILKEEYDKRRKEQEAQKELKISAYKKLGLTDEEIAAII